MTTSWHTRPLAGFDTETTGVDIETDRIVTAALITYRPDGTHTARTWLSDLDGATIPAEATAIHGITTEHAHTHGTPARDVINDIVSALESAIAAGRPLTAMNARFDLTILDRECRRHSIPTLSQRFGRTVGPVIDPLIIDKQVDKYRKGSRKLTALADHYGIKLADAHTADADALAAVQVAIALAEKYPELQTRPDQLHVWQARWAAEQARSFREYRLQQGLSAGDIHEVWPLIPFAAVVPQHQPTRGDAVEAWLKQQRDTQHDQYGPSPLWYALDGLLDTYRLHADTRTPLGEHACEQHCDCNT